MMNYWKIVVCGICAFAGLFAAADAAPEQCHTCESRYEACRSAAYRQGQLDVNAQKSKATPWTDTEIRSFMERERNRLAMCKRQHAECENRQRENLDGGAVNPRWEPAFSADGGKTWETNWIMHFHRPADIAHEAEKAQ